MALIVETGSIVPNADSYISVLDADAYNTSLGRTDWVAGTADAKEIALRKACVYIDSRYRGRWKGRKTDQDQSLAWPRAYVTDEDGYTLDDDNIPRLLKNAQCLAAYRIFNGEDLMPALDRGGRVQSTRIDVIQITYADGAPSTTTYQEIDTALSGFLSSTPGSGLTSLPIERA